MKTISLISTLLLVCLALGDAAKCNAKTPAPASGPAPAPSSSAVVKPAASAPAVTTAPAASTTPATNSTKPAAADSDASGAGSATATKSAGCGKTATLKSGTLTAGGRQFILRLPDDYDSSTPYRVVFTFHWRGGNMEQAAKHTGGYDNRGPNNGFYGLEQAGKASTIFVSPQGNGAGWANGGGADITFVDAINKMLDEGLCVNTNLRFAMGFSWGAGMSNAVACARADQFRGVALWNGATLSGCDGGKKPIAWWSAHGVSDNVLAISMGRGLRDNFVKVNGCTAQTPQEPAAGSGTHITTEYKGCSAGHPVVWTAYDGGHIAEPKDKGAKDAWGPAAVWSFFSQFK